MGGIWLGWAGMDRYDLVGDALDGMDTVGWQVKIDILYPGFFDRIYCGIWSFARSFSGWMEG